jgi:hypothetical protein
VASRLGIMPMGVIMPIMLVVMVVTKNSQTLEHEKSNQAR